ncbi:MAG: type II toxin-antitoxin system HicB family antitoxin [Limisphaerales bacterium]
MKRQFTAILKKTDKWFIAFCPEVPGANGQGKTRTACLEDLTTAVELMLEVNREQILRQVGTGGEEARITVG